MLLTYSIPKFKDLIRSGQKIHTIRPDAHNRWKPGMSIQHWMYNPRNKSKNPHLFGEGECKGVERIFIVKGEETPVLVMVNRQFLKWDEVLELIENDGLTLDEFIQFFASSPDSTFIGRIIHFTDKKYRP